jgi:hypothetical protein
MANNIAAAGSKHHMFRCIKDPPIQSEKNIARQTWTPSSSVEEVAVGILGNTGNVGRLAASRRLPPKTTLPILSLRRKSPRFWLLLYPALALR